MIIYARVLKKSLLFHETQRFVTVILSHINLIYNIPFYFFKIHSGIILPSMLRSLSFRFSYRNFVQTFLPHVILAPPNSTSFVWQPKNNWREAQVMKLQNTQFSLGFCYFLPLGQHNTPRINIPMFFPLMLRYQDSHSQNTKIWISLSMTLWSKIRI